MAVGDIYLVTNEFTYQGNANQYGWYLRVAVQGNPALVNSDLLQFGDERQTAWLPLQNLSVQFRCVTVRQVYPDNSLPVLVPELVGGQRSCPDLSHIPGQCSAVVTLYGDIVNPTSFNRGRDFVTGQCCNDQANGEWNNVAGYLEDLCAMYAAMTNQFVVGGNTYDIGIYSPTRAKPPTWPVAPSIPPFFWVLQHVRGRQLVRTQRRRQPLDPCEEVCDQAIPGAVPPP